MMKALKWSLRNLVKCGAGAPFYSCLAARMSQTPLVSGMVLGGVVISALGAASTKFLEEKNPSVKSLGRDFIIGAVMVAMIIQLLPESSTSVIEFALNLVPLTLFAKQQAEVVEAVSDDIEVKVGVPKF